MPQVLALGPSANIQNCSDLHQQMMEMLGANDVVTLDASALEAIDLTFLQLVHALRTDAAAQGKQVALSAPANPHLSAILTRAGFAPGASPSDDDFWFQGVLPQ